MIIASPPPPTPQNNRQGPLSADTFQHFITTLSLVKYAKVCALEPWPLEDTLASCIMLHCEFRSLWRSAGVTNEIFGKNRGKA